jgi:hypothetical protein
VVELGCCYRWLKSWCNIAAFVSVITKLLFFCDIRATSASQEYIYIYIYIYIYTHTSTSALVHSQFHLTQNAYRILYIGVLHTV